AQLDQRVACCVVVLAEVEGRQCAEDAPERTVEQDRLGGQVEAANTQTMWSAVTCHSETPPVTSTLPALAAKGAEAKTESLLRSTHVLETVGSNPALSARSLICRRGGRW